MSKRSMQKKVAKLQEKWDGDSEEANLETGEWSPENIAKNREKASMELNPWVEHKMTCFEWYEKIIKPKIGAQAT